MATTNPFEDEPLLYPPSKSYYNFDIFNGKSSHEHVMFFNNSWYDDDISILIKYIFMTKQYPEIHQKIIELLKTDPSLVNKQTKLGITPLMCAVRFYKEYTTKKIIKILLEHGADINLRTRKTEHNKQWNVFDIVTKFGKTGSNGCILQLLNSKKQWDTITPLYKINNKLTVDDLLKTLPNLATFESLLQQNTINLDELTSNGLTCFEHILNQFFYNSDVSIVKESITILVKYGAKQNIKNKDNQTTLEYYIDKGSCTRYGIFEHLINNGFTYNNLTKAMTCIAFYGKSSKSSIGREISHYDVINYFNKYCKNEDFNFVDSDGNNILHNFFMWNTNQYYQEDYNKIIEYLLLKVNLLTKNNKGHNVLHTYIIYGNDIDTHPIKKYITEELTNISTDYGETPLFLAIIHGKNNTLNIIYNFDKNINYQIKSGKTSIMYVKNYMQFEYLMQNIKNIDLTIKDNDGKTMMDIIMESNDWQKPNFVLFFLKHKLIGLTEDIIKICDEKIKTNILRKLDLVKEVCSYGIKLPKIINAETDYHNSKKEDQHILKYVLSRNGVNYQLIEFIIKQGCTINNSDDFNELIHMYVDTYITLQKLPSRYYSDFSSDPDPNKNINMCDRVNILKLLIQNHKQYFDINSIDKYKWTILMKIIDFVYKYPYELPSLIIYLSSFDINYELTTIDNENILTLLLRNNNDNKNILNMLNMIKNKANINHVTNAKMTPIHIAIEYTRNIKIIELLINNGADLSLEDFRGFTPLMLAYKYNILDVIDLLEKHNAPVNLDNSLKIIKKSQYKDRFSKKYVLNDIPVLASAIKYDPNNNQNIGFEIIKLNHKITMKEDIKLIYNNLDIKIKTYLGINSLEDMIIKIKEFTNQ